MRTGRVVRLGAVSAIGLAAAMGGLAAAGALPDVGILSGGHSSVDAVPPTVASPTGVEHATSGGRAAADPDVPTGQDSGSDAVEAAGSDARLDGLGTAASNATNDTASTVIDTLINNTPGPGFGQAVADAATGGVPANDPQLPDQAANGQSHRP